MGYESSLHLITDQGNKEDLGILTEASTVANCRDGNLLSPETRRHAWRSSQASCWLRLAEEQSLSMHTFQFKEKQIRGPRSSNSILDKMGQLTTSCESFCWNHGNLEVCSH